MLLEHKNKYKKIKIWVNKLFMPYILVNCVALNTDNENIVCINFCMFNQFYSILKILYTLTFVCSINFIR